MKSPPLSNMQCSGGEGEIENIAKRVYMLERIYSLPSGRIILAHISYLLHFYGALESIDKGKPREIVMKKVWVK